MANAYTVTQVNAYIKNMFDTDFMLNRIKVSGEISNCKYHSSGHIYFTMKDSGGTLACVMFAGDRKNLSFSLHEGMSVVASGTISVYPRDGKYQLYVKTISEEGDGELFARYLELKKELEDMGMFAQEYKKPIPAHAMKVGVVTASTGAAIQDIMNISKRRNPYVQLYLYPAKVQGEGAADTICAGIEALDQMKLDVIIVGRGGGSIEDLWAFNEESVARSIFNCSTPVISAVGHEVDFTIADFVADMRAPTPSAAAELAVFDITKETEYIEGLKSRLSYLMDKVVSDERERLNNLEHRLFLLGPEHKLKENRVYLDSLSDKLDRSMAKLLDNRKQELKHLSVRLSSQSPLDKISGGFGYITGSDEKAVKSITDVMNEEVVKVRLKDGSFDAEVIKVYGESENN